ncbi:transporter associated domain-containing protein, partial [Haloarcula sp. Atlit-7R]
ENTYLVRGEVNIDEVNEMLDIELPEGEEFETLAGFIFNRAGRLVEEGEEISYNDIVIRIEQVDNTRIMKARIRTNAGIEAADGNGDDDEENGGDEEAEVEPDT